MYYMAPTECRVYVIFRKYYDWQKLLCCTTFYWANILLEKSNLSVINRLFVSYSHTQRFYSWYFKTYKSSSYCVSDTVSKFYDYYVWPLKWYYMWSVDWRLQLRLILCDISKLFVSQKNIDGFFSKSSVLSHL